MLQASRHPTASLADEMTCAQMYLTIEQARFGDRLRIVFDVPEDLRGILMPSLILPTGGMKVEF